MVGGFSARHGAAPLARPGRLRTAPPTAVRYAGPNPLAAFAEIDAIDALGRATAPHRLRLYPPLRCATPLPLFNRAAMPDWVVRFHDDRPMAPAVDVFAVPGHELGGIGLLQQDGRVLVHPEIWPPYINGAITPEANGLPETWLGSLLRAEAEIIETDVPVAVALHPNTVYGHFLLEMLPRLHLLAKLRAFGRPFPIALASDGALWWRRIVTQYFDDSEILWYHSRHQRVRAPCFILPGMMHHTGNFHPEVNSLVDDLVGRCADPAAATPSLVFLSRSRHRGGKHGITNAAEVDAAMAASGFAVVHPQELGFTQQVALMAGAACVVSQYSSASHNALFAPRGAAVLCINWINEYQTCIGALRGQPTGFVAPTEPGFMVRGAPLPDDTFHFRMDCDQLLRQVGAFRRFCADLRAGA